MIRFLARRWLFIVSLFVLMLVLAACGGGPTVTSWPGITVKENTAYLASADQLLAIDISKNVAGAVPGWPIKSPNASIGFYSDPAVMTDTGTLYVGTEQTNANNGNVLAYMNVERHPDQNPALKWSYPLTTTNPPLGNIYGAIVHEGNVLYVADGKGQVFALDADTGNPKWAQPYTTGARIWSSPVVQGERVYAASQDHFLYALDKGTGELAWKFPSDGTSIDALVGSPTVYSNTVYAGSFGGILYAVDASTGTLMWSFKADGTLWDGPAEAKGTLYFGDLSGNVYALDSETGRTKKWTAKVEGGVKMTPLVVDGVVYVGTDQHRMYAFNADNGQAVWAQPYVARDGESFLVTPIVNGDTLLALPNLAGGDPVRLYGLSKNTGARQWQYPPATSQ